MTNKIIVILGGGIGGLAAACTLKKKLGGGHRIIVVDKNTSHNFTGSYLWIMMGQREPSQVSKDLKLLNRKGIEFKNARVVELEPENNRVKTSQGNLDYDYLIIALGADLAVDALPGFSEGSYTPYNIEGAIKLKDALRGFTGGDIVVLISSLPFKCPAAPYETALLADHFFKKKKLRDKISIRLFTPETLPMGVTGPELGKAVVGMLGAKGIGFHPQVKPTQIDNEKKEITFNTGDTVQYDLLIGVPPHKSPDVVRESGLAEKAGWIPVDPGKLKTKYDNVYAVGDTTIIKLPGGLALPKAGVFAHGQAEIVAENIASQIKGKESSRDFDGKGSCFIETGGGLAGYASGNFYATPEPVVNLKNPGRMWHWSKIAFEKWWMRHWL